MVLEALILTQFDQVKREGDGEEAWDDWRLGLVLSWTVSRATVVYKLNRSNYTTDVVRTALLNNIIRKSWSTTLNIALNLVFYQ
jgi:hypothetical protein